MAYIKTTWVDRNIQYPGRYSEVDGGGGIKTFTPSPGTITQAGTTVTAARMNNIETGIETVYTDVADGFRKLRLGGIV